MSVNTKFKFKTVTEFLESVRITNKADKNITHTSMGEKSLDIYPGKYRVEPEKLDAFFKLYTKWIFTYKEELNINFQPLSEGLYLNYSSRRIGQNIKLYKNFLKIPQDKRTYHFQSKLNVIEHKLNGLSDEWYEFRS